MRYKIPLLLFTICLITSVILAFTPTEKICGEEESSCTIVQDSEYKETLGINNSYSGIFIFTILILITVSQIKSPTKKKRKFLIAGSFVSAIGAFYFIFLQLFIIKAICPYCMVIDVSSIIALGILAIKNKRT